MKLVSPANIINGVYKNHLLAAWVIKKLAYGLFNLCQNAVILNRVKTIFKV